MAYLGTQRIPATGLLKYPSRSDSRQDLSPKTSTHRHIRTMIDIFVFMLYLITGVVTEYNLNAVPISVPIPQKDPSTSQPLRYNVVLSFSTREVGCR
jgi:hypothetical protein